MVTVHNSANTAVTVDVTDEELEQVGPMASYVGSYDNLREVSKALVQETMVRAGWKSVRITRVVRTAKGFQVSARRS